MKKIILSLMCLIIVACNSGTSSVALPVTNTYSFTVFNSSVVAQHCTGGPNLICDRTEPVNITAFASYTSTPASYVILNSNIPAGVSFESSGTCQTSVISSYGPCTFSFSSAPNNVESGSKIFLAYNGALGIESWVTITYQ